MSQLTFLSEEPPAKTIPSRGCEREWLATEARSHEHLLKLLNDLSPSGSFGRMSPAFFPAMRAETSLPSSVTWGPAGMGGPTASLTLNMCEHAVSREPCLSAGGVCSLSDILETGDVPQRYYLTAKACAGILRRAGNRGKTLPPQLARALQAVVASGQISTSTED